MKKRPIISIVFLFSTWLYGEITLTAEEHNPRVGDAYTQLINRDPGISVTQGPAGEDVLWDFSQVSTDKSEPIAIISNNDDAFEKADILYSQQSTYSYFTTAQDNFTYMGFRTSSVTLVHSDGEDQVRFPISYGDSYTDSAYATLDGFGMVADRKAEVAVTADGWGTLITPDTTYPSALRIQIIRTYEDFYNNISQGVITDSIYYWYTDNIAFPVVTYFSSGEGYEKSKGFNYLAAERTSITETVTERRDISLVQENEYAELHTDKGRINQPLLLRDIQGQIYHKSSGPGRISTKNIPSGVYIITAQESRHSVKIVIE
jgi:hypothetical protein